MQVIDPPLPASGIHWGALKDILFKYGLFQKFPYRELQRSIFFHGDPANDIARQRTCGILHHLCSGHVTLYFQCPLEEAVYSITAHSPEEILSCVQFTEMF